MRSTQPRVMQQLHLLDAGSLLEEQQEPICRARDSLLPHVAFQTQTFCQSKVVSVHQLLRGGLRQGSSPHLSHTSHSVVMVPVSGSLYIIPVTSESLLMP